MNHCSKAHSQLHLNVHTSNVFWKHKTKTKQHFTWLKWYQKLQTCFKSVFLFKPVREGCDVSVTWPSEHKLTLASTSVSLPCSSLPALKLRHFESWTTSSLPVMIVKCLFSLSLIIALHLIPSITAFSSTGSNMLMAYRNLPFRSFDPIWPKDSKWYPFLVMSSNPSTLCYGVPQGSGLGPFCFFRTHNHSHRSLTDTHFHIVNLPMIANCTIQRHVNIFALWLAICSHV